MSAAVWGGDQLGPGRHAAPQVFESLVLAGDARPPTRRPAHRERTVRAQADACAAPGTINPPSGRVRRQGPGAEYLAPRPDDFYEQPYSRVQAELGAEFFDEPEPEPELESATPPIALGEPGQLHGIATLASALRRKPHTVRVWERRGIIPPAATRTEGVAHTGGLAVTATTSAKRMYTTEEIEAAAQIAADEGLLLASPGRRPEMVNISETEFTARVSAAWARLRRGGQDAE